MIREAQRDGQKVAKRKVVFEIRNSIGGGYCKTLAPEDEKGALGHLFWRRHGGTLEFAINDVTVDGVRAGADPSGRGNLARTQIHSPSLNRR